MPAPDAPSLSPAEPGQPRDPPGPYRLERILGTGGMGEVHLARHRLLGRKVAIKHIRLDVVRRREARERLRREARAAARLSHPSIIQIHDLLESEDGEWIVMELVDGPTLGQVLAHGPLPVARSLELARQIASGLAEAHAKGVLHRDLKSDNIMIATGPSEDDWQAKIMDFGLAKVLWWSHDPSAAADGGGGARRESDDAGNGESSSSGEVTELSLTAAGEVMGTCRAMSPEQAKGQALDGRSDLFSLGSLLYEMLTGISPFEAHSPVVTMTRVVSHQPPPARELRTSVPAEVSSLVSRMMSKAVDERPASCLELEAELTRLARGEEPEHGEPGAGEPQAGEPGADEPGADELGADEPREALEPGGPTSPWQRAHAESPVAGHATATWLRFSAGGARRGFLVTAALVAVVAGSAGFLLGRAAEDRQPGSDPPVRDRPSAPDGIELGTEAREPSAAGLAALDSEGPTPASPRAATGSDPSEEAAVRRELASRVQSMAAPDDHALARALADLERAEELDRARGRNVDAARSKLLRARLERRRLGSSGARGLFVELAAELREEVAAAGGEDGPTELLAEALIEAAAGEPEIDLAEPLLHEALRMARRTASTGLVARAHARLAQLALDRFRLAASGPTSQGRAVSQLLDSARSHALGSLAAAEEPLVEGDRGGEAILRAAVRAEAQLTLAECERASGTSRARQLWLERALRDARHASRGLAPDREAEVGRELERLLGAAPEADTATAVEAHLHLEAVHRARARWVLAERQRGRLERQLRPRGASRRTRFRHGARRERPRGKPVHETAEEPAP
ncbi:MAG: serine/threonine protein kinase [Holophagales bacterium]|nr:serine/threonine protein kinase [Holophagales bacterium]